MEEPPVRRAAPLLALAAALLTVLPAAAQTDDRSDPVVLRGRHWLVNQQLASGSADLSFHYGRANDLPLWGDWDGDGVSEPGVFRNGTFLLNHELGGGDAEEAISFGRPGDVPLSGDWNADGVDDVGVRRGRVFHLDIGHGGGAAERSFSYGRPTDTAFAGDFDGDQIDDVGVRRGRMWYLEHENPSDGRADRTFAYGRPSDVAVVGRWTTDAGTDQIGVVRGRTWFLRHELAGGAADQTFAYGDADDWFATGGGHGQSVLQPQVEYRYTIGERGQVDQELDVFAAVARTALGDQRSWTLGRELWFTQVPDAGYAEDFHLWLADPQAVDAAAPGCDAQYSCTVGDDVYINEERWEQSTSTWDHRSLYDYRRYVIIHEVGHWLELDHRNCPAEGAPAPVMQQQSIDLEGCETNLFPLPSEKDAVRERHLE